MAIAGDVIIKLAADFAEFVQGIDASTKKLDEFGKTVDKMGASVEGFISGFKKIAAGAGILGVVFGAFKIINDEVDRLQTKFSGIADEAAKLGASFGEFEKLRLASLDAGVGTDKLSDAMGRLKGFTDQAVAGNKDAIDTLNRLKVTILDNEGKQRTQVDINERLAAAILKLPPGIERTRLEMKLLGEAGAGTEKTLSILAKSQQDLNDKYQTDSAGSAIARLKDLEKQANASREQIDLMIASVVLPIKATALENVATSLSNIQAEMKRIELQEGFWAKWRSLFNQPGVFDPQSGKPREATQNEKFQLDLERAQAEADQARKELFNAYQRGGEAERHLQVMRERVAKADAQVNTLLNDQAKRGAAIQTAIVGQTGFVAPDPTGGSNPPTTTATGGGTGPTENAVEAQIRRYNALAKASDALRETIKKNQSAPVEELQRAVEVQRQVDEIVAKQGGKAGVSDEQRKRLEAAALAAAKATDAQKQLMESNIAADATERRLGDGTEQHARALRDLEKQHNTGRISTLAYNRAIVEEKQRTQDAADAAARLDNDLGSLAAGFDKAARDFAKANDMFSQGQQLFTGLTGAMGESLDVLVGKSSKSFEQIGSDFALMLAKMALNAALSPVFKQAGNILSGLFSKAPAAALSATDISQVAFAFAPGLASGGPVEAGRAYTVGEYGIERFIPSVAGRVEPMSAGGGSSSVTVNVDMGQQSGASDPSSAMAFGRKMKAAVLDVIQNERRPGGTLYHRVTA